MREGVGGMASLTTWGSGGQEPCLFLPTAHNLELPSIGVMVVGKVGVPGGNVSSLLG
jgi:hypothetical protein